MGEPALKLLPAEKAAGDAAARQATRLVLIEGGKRAAPTGVGVAAEGLAPVVGRGALVTGGSVAAFLAAFFWPSSLADGTLPQQYKQAPNAAVPSPVPVPEKNEEIQRCPARQGCPPHDWYEDTPGMSIDEAVRDLQVNKINPIINKPSKADGVRGYVFERDAAKLNNEKHPIETMGAIYKCRRCPAVQEVDIIFKDGQIAESKSKKRVDGDQAERLLDLQSFFNCNGRASFNFKPLAKLDINHKNIDKVARGFERRGFEVERLRTPGKP